MGEQKITEGMLNNIAYSGDQVAAIYMPVKDNGDIDWEGFHAFTQAEEYVSEQNITDIDSKNMIHARFGSYAQFDREGNVKPTRNTARYMVTYGYTIDDHISDDNRMVEELTGDAEKDADAAVRSINQCFSDNGLIVPDAPFSLSVSSDGPNTIYGILPGFVENGELKNGTLEDLCLQILIDKQSESKMDMIQEYLKELQTKFDYKIHHIHKSKLHTYFASDD
jgi:hypothetical protein